MPRYAGVDEVGYGALAGPLVSVAVAVDADVPFSALKKFWPVDGVRDSKQTTPAQRAVLVPRIVDYLRNRGGSVGIGEIPVSTIDKHGYSKSLAWSKLDAVQRIRDDGVPDILIVDGSVGLSEAHPEMDGIAQRVAPKADANYWVVAAASILAKYYRDQVMRELDDLFPEYGWIQNSGYAGGGVDTSMHVAALRRYGLSPHHRKKPCETILSAR